MFTKSTRIRVENGNIVRLDTINFGFLANARNPRVYHVDRECRDLKKSSSPICLSLAEIQALYPNLGRCSHCFSNTKSSKK